MGITISSDGAEIVKGLHRKIKMTQIEEREAERRENATRISTTIRASFPVSDLRQSRRLEKG